MGYPSVFGGQYIAANFAYGSPGGPNALVVDSLIDTPASPPVAQSLIVSFGYTTTIDGILFYPLADNAPVNVGSADNAEEVTPSSVTNNGRPDYDQVSFVADFANQHGRGDPVASATFGLQEAVNLAEAAGGGVVIIDQQWVKIGGTTAIFNTVTGNLPGSVTITDNR